jgi:hypothetical protein
MWMLLAACDSLGSKPGSDGTGDTSTPTTSSQVTTPTEVQGQVDCAPLAETPVPGSTGYGDCVTDVIHCGDTVVGTIAGGSTAFSNQTGAPFEQCSGHGPGDELDGPERVYRLDVADTDSYVTVHLASCETTQLLWYQSTEACPTDHVLCSYVHADGALDQGDSIVLSNAGVVWFVVEGLGGAEGNYALTVQCG